MIQTNETTIQDNNDHQENANDENQVLNINIQHTMNFFDTLLQEITPPNSPFSNNFFSINNNRLSPFHRVKYKKHKNIELLDKEKQEKQENNHEEIDVNENKEIDEYTETHTDNEEKNTETNLIKKPSTPMYGSNKTIISIKEYEENQPVCIICLDIFDDEDTIFSNIKDLYTTKKCNCKYYVHKNCLNNWIYDNEKCLMCKDPFQTIELMQDKLLFYEELEKKYMTKIHGNLEEIREEDYNNLVSDYHTLSGPFNYLSNTEKTCCSIYNNRECLDCMRHFCVCIITFILIVTILSIT